MVAVRCPQVFDGWHEAMLTLRRYGELAVQGVRSAFGSNVGSRLRLRASGRASRSATGRRSLVCAGGLMAEIEEVSVSLTATACDVCGKDPADGFAFINDRRYCHGDDNWFPDDPAGRTCYELSTALRDDLGWSYDQLLGASFSELMALIGLH